MYCVRGGGGGGGWKEDRKEVCECLCSAGGVSEKRRGVEVDE